MSRTPSNVEQIADQHLCTGCGACAGLFPEHIKMFDTLAHGKRPRCRTPEAIEGRIAEESVRICPGLEIRYQDPSPKHRADAGSTDEWGPILEVWEGHAWDEDLRFKGSSGGLANALGLWAIEAGGMRGVSHVKACSDVPYLNETTISHSREDLLQGSGSRYAPASPCDRLSEIESGNGAVAFIGKPCDIAAVSQACQERPSLDEKIGLKIAIFCAGTPSLEATFDLMAHLGSDHPDRTISIRYRGNGWPGKMKLDYQKSDGSVGSNAVSYDFGWGNILQKKRQWRCQVCADHVGELADISVGDPWYRAIQPNEAGSSLIVVRTERGRRAVREAIAAGYVVLHQRPVSTVAASQTNLMRTRGAVWGRLLGLRLLGISAPRYVGLNLYKGWLNRLSLKEKTQSIVGTWKRIAQKGLYRKERQKEFTPGGLSITRLDSESA